MSSFNDVISDFLILPLNLNLDNLAFSTKFIWRKTIFPTIFSIEISTSEKSPCCQSFLTAEDIFSPGIAISSPTDIPLIAISVLLFKFSAPFTTIPPISNFSGEL